jgi:glycosyltransferase involved in cell wall biosynthesis
MAHGGVEAVVCFDFYTYAMLRVALAGRRGSRPRVFISVHSSGPATKKESLQDAVYTRLLHPHDTIVAVCHAQVDALASIYGIAPSRFRVVYTGVDVNHYNPDSVGIAGDALRRGLGVPIDADVILCVANVRPVKALHITIRALALLIELRRGRDARLYIVGHHDTALRGELERLAASLGVADRVVFAGPQPDVRPYYNASDVFTLSSASEAFSRAALEAMSMGLPCVLTDVGGAREMIREGVDGYVVPGNDPIGLASAWCRVLERPSGFGAGRIRLGVAERFSLTRFVREYECMLLGGTPRGLETPD